MMAIVNRAGITVLADKTILVGPDRAPGVVFTHDDGDEWLNRHGLCRVGPWLCRYGSDGTGRGPAYDVPPDYVECTVEAL